MFPSFLHSILSLLGQHMQQPPPAPMPNYSTHLGDTMLQPPTPQYNAGPTVQFPNNFQPTPSPFPTQAPSTFDSPALFTQHINPAHPDLYPLQNQVPNYHPSVQSVLRRA